MPTQTTRSVSKAGIDLIKSFEGLFLESYRCPAGVWTIGYGSILWGDNRPVEPGQKITMEQAEKLLTWEVNKKAAEVNALAPNTNQHQFDSLVSFAYNLGTGALKNSTLLRKVKANPNDPEIGFEFMKWVNAGGKKLNGLVKRRRAEAELYFKTI